MTGLLTLVPTTEVSAPVARAAAALAGGTAPELTATVTGVYPHSVTVGCRQADGGPLLVNLTATPVEAVCQARIPADLLAELRHSGLGTPVVLDAGGAAVVSTRLCATGVPAPFRAPASWFDTGDGRRFGRPRLDRAARAILRDEDPDALEGLCGLGIGLTPSGDDALVGLLATARAAGVGTGVIGRFATLLEGPGADRLTTGTSLCQLRLGLGGDFSPTVLALLDALVGSRDPGAAVDRLSRVGHSSGADLMAGVDALARRLAPAPSAEIRPQGIPPRGIRSRGGTGMRIVIGVGGNAIAPRGRPNTVADQRAQIRQACGPLLDVATDNELVITHGNGPQVGMLALQRDPDGRSPLPLDVLGAETQGMIGYLIETELRNEMTRRTRALTKQQRAEARREGEPIRSGAAQRLVTTVLTLAEVSLDDPAFQHPTKFVGPVYTPEQAEALAAEHGWTFAEDGDQPRRVVPSPRPRRIIQVDSTKQLLAAGHIVICTGGGGIPIARDPKGYYVGVEAVLDKDASSALFASELKADVLVMATDADAVMVDWGTPQARPLRTATVAELERMDFAEGSMGPKVQAGCDFVKRHHGRAVIGRLSDLAHLLDGTAGTTIC